MANRSTLRVVAEELAFAFEPLRRGFRTLQEFRLLMWRLGWRVESLPSSYAEIASHVDELLAVVTNLGDDPELPDLLNALDPLRDVVGALRALSDAPDGVDPVLFLADIRDGLIEVLLLDYLSSRASLLHRILIVVGAINEEKTFTGDDRPMLVRRRFRRDAIQEFLDDPSRFVERAFAWGTQDLEFSAVLAELVEILATLGIPARLVPVMPARRDGYHPDPVADEEMSGWMLIAPLFEIVVDDEILETGFAVLDLPGDADNLPGIIIEPVVPEEVGDEVDLGGDLTFRLRAGSDIARTFGVLIRPNSISVRYPFESEGQPPSAGFGMSLAYAPQAATNLLGRPSGTRIEIKGTECSFTVDSVTATPEVAISVVTHELALVIGGEADGFVGTMLGNDIRVPIALSLRWSNKAGLGFGQGQALTAMLSPGTSIGPVRLERIVAGIRGQENPAGLAIDVAASLAGKLGPVSAVVENVGFAVRAEIQDGNLGPLNLSLGFSAPKGVSIAIDAGPATGGGFLSIDSEAGRYTGALHLRIYEISVSAFGVIDTKLPSGKGFSFVVLIAAEFTPIQLGLGFTLNGVGGAIGIHRTLSKQALDEAVRSGRLEHILFPKDPAARAPEIIRDLQAYFPPAEGRYTFGPLAKIGWGTPNILEAKLGLILELPHPVRLTLLGTVSAGLPSAQKRFVKLNLAIVGQLDFDKKTFALDASLYDSDVGGFTLSGDAAMRLAWGRDANFAMAIGGFNPQFQPPAGFPALRRVAVDISAGGSPRVTCQAYLAITSNTLQVGARAELSAGGHWNIYGWIGFDALFVFQPFGFAADFSAGVALRQGTRKRASVTVHGTLKGPNPWYVKGKACISCFFFDICVGFDVTLSQKRPDAIEPVPSRLDALAKAVGDARNWSAVLQSEADRVVALAATDTPVVDPLGTIVVRQKELPLDELITRFAAQALPKDQFATYEIESVTFVGGPSASIEVVDLREPFARAQFQELPDAKKLSLPAFEPMVAGGRIESTALDVGARHAAEVKYQTFIVNDTSAPAPSTMGYSPAPGVTDALAYQSAAATTGVRVSGARKYAASVVAVTPRLTLEAETYAIVSTRTLDRLPASHPLGRVMAGNAVSTMTKGKALALLAQHLAAHPADRGELQVVSEDELAAAA